MSLEAWGDEGNVPQRAEDCAMYQEFVAILGKLQRWERLYKSEDIPEIGKFYEILNAMDDYTDILKEHLKP